MFTGIIEKTGIVVQWDRTAETMTLVVRIEKDYGMDVHLGDSIAVNGVCLTVVFIEEDKIGFNVAEKTRERTTLFEWRQGKTVNLEKAMQLNSRLGGHIVSGHVDGVGKVHAIKGNAKEKLLHIHADSDIIHSLVNRGSLAVDGVSLTIGECKENGFLVYLVPFTLQHTTLSLLKVGDLVNLETDILGKYVQKYIGKIQGQGSAITEGFLKKQGFI